MSSLDYEAWRCCHDEKKFCPAEGCSTAYGCARDKGWDPSKPSPFADPATGQYVPMGFAEEQADIINATGAWARDSAR